MENKKKVLYLITQSELGGAQKYVFDLADNLKDDYCVAVGMGEQGEAGWLNAELKNKNIKTFILKNLRRKICLVNDIKAILEIKNIFDTFSPDIIHLNSTKASILGSAAYALSKTKAKLIYTAHGWVFNEPMGIIKKKFYKFAELLASINKQKIICVSEFDKELAINNSFNKNKLETIHNGVKKINFFDRFTSRNKLSNIIKHSINDSNFLIGSIGNLYATKGFKYLLEAFYEVKKKIPNAILIIVGEGEERKKLQKIINNFLLAESAFLVGNIKNASKMLKAFDVYVNSSVKEGLSYTLLEAMQAELPIIATKVGGSSELLQNGAGILIDPKESKKLKQSIINIYKNNSIMTSLKENAGRQASQYRLDDMTKKTINAYKQ